MLFVELLWITSQCSEMTDGKFWRRLVFDNKLTKSYYRNTEISDKNHKSVIIIGYESKKHEGPYVVENGERSIEEIFIGIADI